MTQLLSTETPLSSSMHQDNSFVVMKNANSVQEIAQNALTFSSTNTVFSFYATDIKAILDGRIELEMSLDITSSIAAGGNVSRIGKICPRSYGLNSAIQSCLITINGCALQSQPYVIKNFLEHCDVSDDFLKNSLGYGYTDRCSNHTLERLYTGDNAFLTEDLSQTNLPSRGSWKYAAGGTDNSATSRTDTFVFREPLLHSLLQRGIAQYGLSNIRMISINLQHPNLARAFSCAFDGTFDTASVVMTPATTPKLHTRFEIPNVKVPDSISLPWIQWQHYFRDGPVMVAGVTPAKDITSDNMVISVVPEKIYIFVPQNLSSKGPGHGDGFLCINSLSLSFGQAQNKFSGASQFQLYQMSCRNGLRGVTFRQWSERLGSIIIIDVAKDIGGYVAGCAVNTYIKYTVNVSNNDFVDFANTSGQAWNGTTLNTTTKVINYLPQLNTVLQCRGRLEINPQSAQSSLGFSLEEAQALYAGPEAHYDELAKSVADGSMSGGSFKDFVKGASRFFSQAKDGIRSANRMANPLLNQLAVADPKFAGMAKGSNAIQDLIGKSLMYS